MRKRVGIREVAAAAGVSVTTVSHVLNETPRARVGEATRVRVRDAAAAGPVMGIAAGLPKGPRTSYSDISSTI